MKKLLLIRHAKSSWESGVTNDFDRPLNERGKQDAPEMAKRLLKKDVKIDAFVSSPAQRAFTTASIFAEAYGRKWKDVVQVTALYHPEIAAFHEAIEALENDDKTVAIFSHNPGITDFINDLGLASLDNLPTCGIFAVKADIKKWKDFREAKKEFWFFDYPKLK